jgi:hypothetical protein
MQCAGHGGHLLRLTIVHTLLAPFLGEAVSSSTARPLIGINYFSGWWHGPGDKWLEPWDTSVDWRPLFPERVPLIGDGYNSPATMDAEIAAASSHGVDFFQILWYVPACSLLPTLLAQHCSANTGTMTDRESRRRVRIS